VLERQLGPRLFRKLFKTVTGDNGGKFSDIEGIERSTLSGKQRLTLYFAHPYSSFERGTNENHNGIIRRHTAKPSAVLQRLLSAVAGLRAPHPRPLPKNKIMVKITCLVRLQNPFSINIVTAYRKQPNRKCQQRENA
jgi:hypothetical protein